MPPYLDALAASPWILVVVLVVAGLDAILPFMPSESTVVACGVATATTGRPVLALLVLVAALGAYAGDQLSYRLGRRGTAAVTTRLTHHRARRLHDGVHRLLHRRGGLVIVFARYVPGGRSTTTLAAGLVGYPARRFGWYTALAVLVWSLQAALIGYLGGALFAGEPLLALLLGWAIALAITGVAVGVRRAAPTRSWIGSGRCGANSS